MKAYAVTAGRSSTPAVLPQGRGQVVETAKVALAFYPEAGLLVVQARHPRTGGVVLDHEDLPEDALKVIREFAKEAP